MASQTAYQRGKYAEDKARRDILNGLLPVHTVLRAAASKGPWDLVGVGDEDVFLVSIKRVPTIQEAHRLMASEVARLQDIPVPICATQMCMIWVDRVGWYTQEVPWTPRPKFRSSSLSTPSSLLQT